MTEDKTEQINIYLIVAISTNEYERKEFNLVFDAENKDSAFGMFMKSSVVKAGKNNGWDIAVIDIIKLNDE